MPIPEGPFLLDTSFSNHLTNLSVDSIAIVITLLSSKSLESISKVKGIDLIYLGLFDISVSVGLPGELNNSKVLKRIKECQKIEENVLKIAIYSTFMVYKYK